jgi:cell division protein FtsL
MGKRGRKAKDRFDDLSSNFKDAILQSSTEEIRKRVSEVAILDCTMRAQLKSDPDVAQAKDALKNLMEPYREDLKSYKLQIEFCKRTLDDKGVGGSVTRVEKEATESHARVNKLVEGVLA